VRRGCLPISSGSWARRGSRVGTGAMLADLDEADVAKLTSLVSGEDSILGPLLPDPAKRPPGRSEWLNPHPFRMMLVCAIQDEYPQHCS